MKCQRCEKESTGIVIQLCDDHFDEWEREVSANPSGVDTDPIDKRLMYRKAGGGSMPDDVKSVVLHVVPFGGNKVRTD